MATQVLAFLAEDPDRLSRFFALTGLDAASVRQAAAEPSFARSVLGYLAEDEALLVAFAAAENLRPEHVAASIRSAVGPTDW